MGTLCRTFVAMLALSMWGCVPREQMSSSGGPLLPSLQVSTSGSEVAFLLQVTNTAEQDIELEFTSGQSYDFVVRNGEREIWRWSSDQMFTQALRNERLASGESLRYEARWQPPATVAGEFEAVGMLTARNHPVEQSTRIQLP